jgi:hypothetical protein
MQDMFSVFLYSVFLYLLYFVDNSGKDLILPSRDEAKRLKKVLKRCTIRYYKDAGHTLLLVSVPCSFYSPQVEGNS